MSPSSSVTGAEVTVSFASTPERPMARSALHHCRRVLVIAKFGALILWIQVASKVSLSNWTRYVVLLFDALPQRLEVLALQHGLTGLHLLALVGVLDLQASCQFAEDLFHLRELGSERLWQGQRAVL